MAISVADFQKKYHLYHTKDEMVALAEAMKLEVRTEDGKIHKVAPVLIGEEYCLILDSALPIVAAVLKNDPEPGWDKDREKRKSAQYWARKKKKA